eukprot:TRINITY_DN22734_c0_g1_i1.p1 TRINITY_DN22734_c0_g1~~TRINITY_DN22734_c0_g1_i1.p1  ORF type:complete len:452 (+),score=93.97 TRINITY_DN22734_c0_g1_i1:77-1357(+)
MAAGATASHLLYTEGGGCVAPPAAELHSARASYLRVSALRHATQAARLAAADCSRQGTAPAAAAAAALHAALASRDAVALRAAAHAALREQLPPQATGELLRALSALEAAGVGAAPPSLSERRAAASPPGGSVSPRRSAAPGGGMAPRGTPDAPPALLRACAVPLPPSLSCSPCSSPRGAAPLLPEERSCWPPLPAALSGPSSPSLAPPPLLSGRTTPSEPPAPPPARAPAPAGALGRASPAGCSLLSLSSSSPELRGAAQPPPPPAAAASPACTPAAACGGAPAPPECGCGAAQLLGEVGVLCESLTALLRSQPPPPWQHRWEAAAEFHREVAAVWGRYLGGAGGERRRAAAWAWAAARSAPDEAPSGPGTALPPGPAAAAAPTRLAGVRRALALSGGGHAEALLSPPTSPGAIVAGEEVIPTAR